VSARVPPHEPASSRRVVIPGAIGERPYRIVFVCTGNICRSPMAEVMTRFMAQSTPLADGTTLGDHLDVRSAGTGPWHEGEPMHPFAQEALLRAEYPRHPHVAHQIVSAELARIDLVVALDRRHRQTLRGLGADPDSSPPLRRIGTRSGPRRRLRAGSRRVDPKWQVSDPPAREGR